MFCGLGLLITAATVHEYWEEQLPKKEIRFLIRLLRCFSVIQNCRNLVSTKDDRVSLSWLYGIRVLTTCWVVFQHSFSDMIGRNSYNTETIMKVNEIAFYKFFLFLHILCSVENNEFRQRKLHDSG